MFTLLRQENYKLLKSKTLATITVIITLYQMLTVFLIHQYHFMTPNDYLTGFSGFSSILDVIVVVFASTVITNEFVKGTIKNLLDRQYKRGQVFLSKMLVIIEVYLFTVIVTAIMMLIAKLTVFSDTTITSKMMSQMSANFWGTLIYLVLLISIIILISNIAKSSGGAIGIGVAAIFATQIISQLLALAIHKVPMLKWNPFNFFQVEFQLETGKPLRLLTKLSDTQMVIGALVYAFIFYAIAYTIFKKRNV